MTLHAWLWGAVTSWVTVFVVRMSRGGEVARELLGERFGGILVTDRYSAYNWYPVRWRQLCWAHLLRDFEAMRDRGGGSEEIGDALLAQAHQMFTWWHRVREGTLKRSTFRSYMPRFAARSSGYWKRAADVVCPRPRGRATTS